MDKNWLDSASSIVPEEKAASDTSWLDAASKPVPRTRSLIEAANDYVIEGANAAAGGVSSAANFLVPGNKVSSYIDENIIKAGEAKQSDVVKDAKRKLSEGLAGATGPMQELGAVGEYIVENPLLAASQAAGSFALPAGAVKGMTKLATLGGAGAGAASTAGRVGGVAAGAAMAGGDAAGTAYELSKKAGATDEQAEAAGRQASVIPALVGGVTGAFGAEKLLAGGKGFQGGIASRALKTGLSEAGQEAIEEGVTQYEGQRAAMPYDPSIDPTKGVAGAAGMGAALGFIPGAGLGALDAYQNPNRPQAQPQPVTGTVAPPTDSPIVGTSTVEVDGKVSTKVNRQDGSVDIDGVQVVPPTASVESDSTLPVDDVIDVEPITPVKPSEAMGIDRAAGPLSRAAADAVDSGASPAITPTVMANPLVQAAQAPAPTPPVVDAASLKDRTTEELRGFLRNAQDTNIRKAISSELARRKREEMAAMPDPLQQSLIDQPKAEQPRAAEAPKAVQSQPQAPQEQPRPLASLIGGRLTDTDAADLVGKTRDPLRGVIQAEPRETGIQGAANGLPDTGVPPVTGAGAGDTQRPSGVSDAGRVRGRPGKRAVAAADAELARGSADRAGDGRPGTGEGSAALNGRPARWRQNALQAKKVARELGLNPDGKRLAEIVAEVDAFDARSNVQDTPQGTERVQAQAPADQAPEAARGDGAEAGRVPDTRAGDGVRANGVEGITRTILESIADQAKKTNRKYYDKQIAKGLMTRDEADRRIANDDKMWAEQKVNDRTERIAKAIAEKDPTVLVGAWAKEGQGTYGNEGSMEAFRKLTGINLARMNSADRAKAIFDWAGWSEDQVRTDVEKRRAERNEQIAKAEEKRKQDDAAGIERLAASTKLTIEGQDGETTVKAYIDGLIEQGYTEIGQTKVGAIKRTLLFRPGANSGYPMRGGILADYAKVASERFKAQQPPAQETKPTEKKAQEPKAEEAAQAQATPQQQEAAEQPQQADKQGEATDDRDTFTLTRLNRETNQMEPVTFKRGEYVRYMVGKEEQFGDIDGISQARREFSVDGIWFPMGYAYKAERPAAPERKDMVPMSKVIEKMNAKNGEGLTDADRVPEQKPASKTPTVDRHSALMQSVREGKATADQFKVEFESLVENKAAVVAELDTMTKAELLKAGGYFIQMRYANEKKGEIIDAIYRQMVSSFVLGDTLSYGMGKGAFEAAVRKHVEATDDAKLEQYAKDRQAAIAEAKAERAAKAAALENPQTLADFKAVIAKHISEGKSSKEAFLSLTPEQRIQFDTLAAEETKDARETRKRMVKTEVRAANQTTGGEIIATKHTRDGYDLFVVQLADRLSKDDYTTVLASAKRMGGWYSSFRGNGAIPGFQFKSRESADAFLKLAAGDTSAAQEQAQQRRDAFEDDRSQSAVERLREMAEKIEDRASEDLSRERKTNTARRARFAAAAERAAEAEKAMARTMRNIAQAIDEGRAKFLDAVRTKSQVEMLTSTVRTAKDNELRAKYDSYAEQEKRRGEPPTAETADFAEFPSYTAFRSDLATLGRQMLEVDGTKKLGQRLMSVADDVSDAYMDFAKENIGKVSQFMRGDDMAVFASRDQAERAIKRSNLTGKAIVLPVKRGDNRIILSPSEAINRGVWTGDGDKRITLTADFGNELVEAIGARGNKTNGLSVPWQFQNTYDRRKALARIGIETPSEFRSALREFIALQERATANKVRELELKMVGRKNDGLDFFPTPAEIADQMVEAADIKPDMAVLEPSAGMGHIADRIRAAGAEPDVIEISPERRELLLEKGYNTQDVNDFTDLKPREFFTFGDVFRAPDGIEGIMRGAGNMGSDRVRLVNEAGDMVGAGFYNRSELTGVRHNGSDSGYDRIVMNPPFSNRRDAEHVQHAYTLLKPGGRIVAIMGEGVFFGSDKKAQDFRDWLDSVGGTSEKLPAGSFMDPSLPVNTGVSARMVVIDKPAGDAQADEANFGTKEAKRQGTPVDRAVMDMAGEGRDANDILSFIANTSKSPYRRNLARKLLATGANPAVSLGGEMGGGAGFRFLAKYSRKNHEVTLSEAAGDRAEQIFLHETVHAATLLALDKGGLQAQQMIRLYESAKKQGLAEGQYGMKNVGEFVAEAFTNPEFQKILKSMKAPEGNLWKRFVALVRRILGMSDGSQDMLTAALEVGAKVMRENMPLRAARSFRAEDGPAFMGVNQTETPAFRRWFGASKVVDADGKPLVVYHWTDNDFSVFDMSMSGEGAHFGTKKAAIERARGMASIGYEIEEDEGQYFVVADSGPKADEWQGPFATKKDAISFRAQQPKKIEPMAVYLGIKNPIRLPDLGTWSAWDIVRALPDGTLSESERAAIMDANDRYSELRETLLDKGIDGVIYRNEVEDKGSDSYIAFKPEQIKSAIGNNGNFDPEDADIAHFGIADASPNNAREAVKQFDLKQMPRNTWGHYRGMLMQALGRRQIVDLYSEELPQLVEYDRLVQQMDAEKNDTGAEADKLATEWGKLDRVTKKDGEERRLAELMHDATLAQIDPEKEFVAGDNRLKYGELKARFDSLTPEAQAIYRQTRDMYSDHYNKVRQAIKDRIERSELSASRKKEMMAKMDDDFFKKVKGVYFPLARFGSYVMVTKDAAGDVVNVTRAETLNEAQEARRQIMSAFPKEQGYTTTKVMKDAEFNPGRDAVGKGFMADLFETLDKQGVDESLRDSVSQLYLSSLPDLSWAKHGIHRKGTPGFSQDARRAFAQNMFHGARYLAKLRYADQMQTQLNEMQDHIKAYSGVEEYDGVQAQQVVDEMVKRHDFMMNPKVSPVSTALTSIGFVFHLGLSPASAMVNLSQTALVAYPIMGAKWGFTRASTALLKASREVVQAKNDLSKALKGDELDAFNKAVKDGTIDVTMAHDLAGISQGEDQKVVWAMRPVMRAASFMFHHAERFNRQATFMAAYRLSKESGKSPEVAYEEAKKATYDGHYDYATSNRPRLMQGNWQKVIFLFKQYAQNMIYSLSRNAYLSVKGLDPAQRSEARKALAGILAAHAAAAGVLGLPLVGPLLAAASFIGGDDDEPWDAEVAMQNMMAEAFGPKAAEVIARGFSRLTPFDLSGRVALNKLILPDVYEGLEGQHWAESFLAGAAGPVAGIFTGMIKGLQKITDGDYQRGFEDMMPAALRGPLKALRYGSEGAVDKSGVVILDEVGPAGVASQTLGFSPSNVRRSTERKGAIMDYDRALADRRSTLMRQWSEARMTGDEDGVRDVMEEIRAFNQKNPRRAITPPNLLQSYRARMKRINEADEGVYLPKNRRDAMDQVRF